MSSLLCVVYCLLCLGNWDNEIRRWVGDGCPTFAVKSTDPKKIIRNFVQVSTTLKLCCWSLPLSLSLDTHIPTLYTPLLSLFHTNIREDTLTHTHYLSLTNFIPHLISHSLLLTPTLQHRGKGVLIISYETQRRYSKMFEPAKINPTSSCDLLICDEVILLHFIMYRRLNQC